MERRALPFEAHGATVRALGEPVPAAGQYLPSLIKHSNATGGVIDLGHEVKNLTPIQFALLEILFKQARDDKARPSAVRGFVASYELVRTLPWDSRIPQEGHLKQLIRRLRKRFEGTGVSLEASQGLGYRVVYEEPASVGAGELQRAGTRHGTSRRGAGGAEAEGPQPRAGVGLCLGCTGRHLTHSVLCRACLSRLSPPLGMIPEHLVASPAVTGDAWLVDGWGNSHGLQDGLVIGRGPAAELRILDCSVSREHARLTRAETGWRCADLGSLNGTLVDGQLCPGVVHCHHGSIVRVGQVPLMLVTGVCAPPRSAVNITRTGRLGA